MNILKNGDKKKAGLFRSKGIEMKNILLFHLESLNNVIFNTNQDCFPNLREFIKNATYHTNYYSTATSTYMVITDLFFGDTFQFENSEYLEDIFSENVQKESIFNILSKHGYATKYYCLGDPQLEMVQKRSNVFCPVAKCWCDVNDKHGMIADAENIFYDKAKPFAIFFQDLESHWMNIEMHSKTTGLTSTSDLFKYKYKMLDETFGMVIKSLKKSGCYEDTIIIAYGDHGDEFLGHGLHDGYTHAIEPFPFMVNCPLIIGNIDVTIKGSVVSTVDIYRIMMSAINDRIYECNRMFAFSRNLFSRQKASVKAFNKSYMVTDGKYALIISKQGLSMFWCNVDTYNGRNLLDFFELDGEEIRYKKIYDNLSASHYRYIMNTYTQKEIQTKLSILLKQLQNFLKLTYQREIDDLNLNKINYSSDINNLNLKFRLYFREIAKDVSHIIKKVTGIHSLSNTRLGKLLCNHIKW